MNRKRWFCIFILVALSQPALAAQPAPREAPRVSLAGAAFDEARGRLVVVGGYSEGAASAETWEWDGTAWTKVDAEGPSPRNEPLLVYDRARKRVVLFGGDRGKEAPATDTWSWDGARWTRLSVDGPSPRTSAMVYDSRRDRIVLFGGGGPTGTLHNDTWEFDGTQWKVVVRDSLPTSPPARALAALAYDAGRGRVVLAAGFAGFDAARRRPTMLADTWEWNGIEWRPVNIVGPGARDHVEAVYDPARRAVVLYGGGMLKGDQPSLVGDTWSYDGRQWIRLSDDGPQRGRHRLVYDTRSKAVLLYGGWSPNSVPSTELWKLLDSRWSRLSPP